MPKFELLPRTGLERLAVPGRHGESQGTPGVTLAVRSDVALATVMARSGQHDALARQVRAQFGLDLPTAPRWAAAGSVAFAWAGPGHWLAMSEAMPGHMFEHRLRTELDGLASVSDQSDGRTLIRVVGPRARDALAKGVMVDLHPRAFGPGDAAVSSVAHVGAHFWQVDDVPTFAFVVFRSLAADFWHWLAGSAAEFGVLVEAE